jgi:transcriptional regulator with XRE-family HTH domain
MEGKQTETRDGASPDSANWSHPAVGDFVGAQIRERRKRKGLTISDLSRVTGISKSNLSKIETGTISASLNSLSAIAGALSVRIQDLFKGFDDEGRFIHIPSGDGLVLHQAQSVDGMLCRLLSASAGQFPGFQPYVVTLEVPLRGAAQITHRGTQVIYMLEGQMRYRYGHRELVVSDGDTAVFDANTPHGPIAILGTKARYFCIVLDVQLSDDALGTRRVNLS